MSQYIKYVIGMKRGIQEKTAIEFALGFYDALGAGKPVEEAFKFGRNAVQLYNISEQLIPILKTKSKKSKRSKLRIKNDDDSVIQKGDALGEEEDKVTVQKSKKRLLQSLIFCSFLGFIVVLFVVIPVIKEPEISYVTNEIDNQDFIFSSVSWPFALDPKGEDITSNYTTGGYPSGVVPRFPFSSQFPTIAANKMCIKFHLSVSENTLYFDKLHLVVLGCYEITRNMYWNEWMPLLPEHQCEVILNLNKQIFKVGCKFENKIIEIDHRPEHFSLKVKGDAGCKNKILKFQGIGFFHDKNGKKYKIQSDKDYIIGFLSSNPYE